MHKIESTPKIITIIGLVLEGLAAPGLLFGYYMMKLFSSSDFLMELDPTITQADIDMLQDLYAPFLILMLVLAAFYLLIFLVNLVLFTKLIRGKFTDEQAHKVYTYQFIWGIISVLTNTLTGILYIVSGNQGRNKQKDRIATRDGI